jgi:hypothetical protein
LFFTSVYSAALYSTLVICRSASDYVFQEYKVDPDSFWGSAVDIVFVTFLSDGRRRVFVLTLKNIKIEWLSMAENIIQWKQLLELSNEITIMNDENVLSLKLKKPFQIKIDNYNIIHCNTVREVMEGAKTEYFDKYHTKLLTRLQKEFGNDVDVHVYALVRVGVSRILHNKIYPSQI